MTQEHEDAVKELEQKLHEAKSKRDQLEHLIEVENEVDVIDGKVRKLRQSLSYMVTPE